MSEERYKLHGITAIIESLKTLKDMFFPLVVLVFANGLNKIDSGIWFLDYLSFIIFGVLIIGFLVSGIVKWKRFVYWFEDNELRIEYGLFIKKKRYIPFDRIQSLDYTEGIFHRPLKLIKVKVETAGNSSAIKAEAELTAITKEAAKHIEAVIARAKNKAVAVATDGNLDETIEQTPVVAQPKIKQIFKMSTKDLLVMATTSGGIGIILSGAVIFLTQFAELIPFEMMYEEISGFVKYGLLIVSIAVFLGFLVVWAISVGMTFLGYYGFSLSLEEDDLVITRGLLEKKRATVPLNRVQSVRIVENPFRQMLGYVTVVIDNAGGGIGDGAKINLLPLVKKTDVFGPLQSVFPDLIFDEPNKKIPPRSKKYFYRIDFLWMFPVIGAMGYYFFPYGLFTLLLIPIIVLFGLWQHRSAAYQIYDQQITMRFRGFSLQTSYLIKRRIQSMEMKQNYFHRRNHVATISSRIKSGIGMFNAQVNHMEASEAERILEWYDPSGNKEM